MGWTSWIIGQVVGTSIILGQLKRADIINVQPQSFKNEHARVVFSKTVSIGEDLSELIERGYAVLYERIYAPQPPPSGNKR
ncbi:hypothetical protein HYH03_017279 [Edaphochlamys debaryana]|uniref:Uncharacterized protein n=1 Tax=Edaphochlamys debaryana TaxID=47281 RepID=A0A835XI92_9CHLO|nr:hypothetical protein HYH03_017279 [Edaphochlamys debaryana]|eukprot:KAG2483885.1 hypothetical protein HYH03_017279 [Edaphochlamys debaryana]